MNVYDHLRRGATTLYMTASGVVFLSMVFAFLFS